MRVFVWTLNILRLILSRLGDTSLSITHYTFFYLLLLLPWYCVTSEIPSFVWKRACEIGRASRSVRARINCVVRSACMWNILPFVCVCVCDVVVPVPILRQKFEIYTLECKILCQSFILFIFIIPLFLLSCRPGWPPPNGPATADHDWLSVDMPFLVEW